MSLNFKTTKPSLKNPTKENDENLVFSSLVLNGDDLRVKSVPRFRGFDSSLRSTTAGPPEMASEEQDRDEVNKLKDSLTGGDRESKYHIVDEVAKGGMGSIHCVYDKDIGRQSVIKVILPNYKDNPDMVKRFMFEARITGLLEHPNIVSMHDIGFLPNFGIYFTMTYVQGESLYDIILNLQADKEGYHKKYDLFELVGIFRKVCDAIAYAHSKNIIHRDIKPENIMVGRFGEVIMMDWGLAKNLDEDFDETPDLALAETLEIADATPLSTGCGSIKGTPVYLSPEQATANPDEIDKSSDIFLLGATLYHIFTHRVPYAGSKLKEVILRAQIGDYPPPEEFMADNNQLSVQLCNIMKKAMSPRKEDRYSSAEALIADLDNLLRGKMECGSAIYEPGDKLLEEDDVGTTCYYIVSGKVDVFKTIDGKQLVLGKLSKGDLVGEMALINDAPRSATAMATERTEVIVLSKEVFVHNLKKLPIWMEKAMTVLAQRLEAANTKLAENASTIEKSSKN